MQPVTMHSCELWRWEHLCIFTLLLSEAS